MKLIDCFMYFDDDLVLDIRLNTLNKYVDKFIIAEATLDHSGNEKELNFDIKKFAKFKDRINYLIIKDLPKKVFSFKKNWHVNHARDQFQRNALERGYISVTTKDQRMKDGKFMMSINPVYESFGINYSQFRSNIRNSFGTLINTTGGVATLSQDSGDYSITIENVGTSSFKNFASTIPILASKLNITGS